jgi:hypothetical protein
VRAIVCWISERVATAPSDFMRCGRRSGVPTPACGSRHEPQPKPRWYELRPCGSRVRRRSLVCIARWRSASVLSRALPSGDAAETRCRGPARHFPSTTPSLSRRTIPIGYAAGSSVTLSLVLVRSAGQHRITYNCGAVLSDFDFDRADVSLLVSLCGQKWAAVELRPKMFRQTHTP